MKIAIIYTGAMRSFDKCWANHKWHVLRHFQDAKIYCVTEQDEDAGKSLLFGAFDATVREVKQPEMVIPKGCPDEWQPGRPYMHEPYHISVDPRAVLGQLWMLREGWRLYQEANEPADLIIRIRPDLWFHSFDMPSFIRAWKSNPATTYIDGGGALAFTPWWGRFGGCNDRFALLGTKAAEAYFTAYDHIHAMISEGAPLHPETLVHYAMKRVGISICDDMKAEFSTLRKTGEMRPPEITMIDLAHFKS
jgi:hypothetical protein